MAWQLASRVSGVLGVALMVSASPAQAGAPIPAPRVDVLVDGVAVPMLQANGTVFIEALRGRPYAIRVSNPWPVRVAVALAVDGLNTIDARHTLAADARKWVVEPYGSIVIGGWQTSLADARRFEFTTEARSYGARLGDAENLGVIAAVFYRERAMPPVAVAREQLRGDAGGAASASGANSAARPAPASAPRTETEYAATGLGERVDHAVREVSIELEDHPAASIRIRYEYRPVLVRLGVLPAARGDEDALTRRAGARGFAPGFCPEPDRRW
jgi:hypothetical protein